MPEQIVSTSSLNDTELPHLRARVDVYGYIRACILDLRIPPESKISIDALARELEVSQTPVREALHQLEGDHLVVKTQGKGYHTTSLLGFAELRELFEFRLLVEPWAAREAAINRLSNPGRVLSAELNDFTEGKVQGTDPRHQLIVHDMAFHGIILEAGRNQFARQAFEATHCHLHLFRLHPADWSGVETVPEHRAIQEAIQNCDPDEAEQAMYDHLMGAYHRFAVAFQAVGVPDLVKPNLPRFS